MNIVHRIKEKILAFLLPKIKSSGYYAVRSLYDDLKVLVNKENPFLIDGGANFGETTDEFLAHYENPTIYCFEANNSLASDLMRRYAEKKNVHVLAQALGSKVGKVNFNISKNLPSSSFLEHTNLHKEYHGDVTATKEVVVVDMVTLESAFPNHETIDLLKLDVEGYELEVLKGAESILPHIRIVMTEVWFSGGYTHAPYFSDIETFLRNNNFTLLNIYNPYTHKDMQLTAGDAVFLNNKFFSDRKHFG